MSSKSGRTHSARRGEISASCSQPVAITRGTSRSEPRAASAAATVGENVRYRTANGVRPTSSFQPQNAACSAAM